MPKAQCRLRWKRLATKVLKIAELVLQSLLAAKTMEAMLSRVPTLTMHAEAMEDSYLKHEQDHIPGFYTLHPRLCDHPQACLKRYGNATGKYQICQICGLVNKARMYVVPRTLEEKPIYNLECGYKKAAGAKTEPVPPLRGTASSAKSSGYVPQSAPPAGQTSKARSSPRKVKQAPLEEGLTDFLPELWDMAADDGRTGTTSSEESEDSMTD